MELVHVEAFLASRPTLSATITLIQDHLRLIGQSYTSSLVVIGAMQQHHAFSYVAGEWKLKKVVFDFTRMGGRGAGRFASRWEKATWADCRSLIGDEREGWRTSRDMLFTIGSNLEAYEFGNMMGRHANAYMEVARAEADALRKLMPRVHIRLPTQKR